MASIRPKLVLVEGLRSEPAESYFYILAASSDNGCNFTMRFRTIVDLDLLTKEELEVWGEKVLFQHLIAKAGSSYAIDFIVTGYDLFFVTCRDEKAAKETYKIVRDELGHYKVH
jgi:hypothetical protein